MTEQRSAAIRRMLASRRRDCVRFCPLAACFVFKNRVGSQTTKSTEGERTLRGAKPLLRRVCWPDYSYERAVKLAALPKGARKKTGLRHPREGQRRGSAVHEQLACLVNEGRPAFDRRYQGYAHPYVGQIARALARLGLAPLVAEFADFDERLRLGTAYDLLCVDGEARAVLVELKVGGDNHWEAGSGPLRAPAALRHCNNGPRNQAFLQLLVYRAMFRRNYPYVPLGGCLVVRVTHEGVHANWLPPPFVAAQDQLVEALERACC